MNQTPGFQNPKAGTKTGSTPTKKIESYGPIGRRRPQVEHIKEEPLSYERELEAMLDAGDYTALDDGF